MEKISAVYQIINEVTGDKYVGSSKDVKRRWANHKCPSRWKDEPNKPLYVDMQKYGVENFRFQILAPVMEEHLKDVEQEFIEILKPTYNNANAKGLDVERRKESNKEYKQSERVEKPLENTNNQIRVKNVIEKPTENTNNQRRVRKSKWKPTENTTTSFALTTVKR